MKVKMDVEALKTFIKSCIKEGGHDAEAHFNGLSDAQDELLEFLDGRVDAQVDACLKAEFEIRFYKIELTEV